jgi:hypothetical protein
MDLLTLFDISIVLGDTFQREFVHEVDLVWLDHVSVLSKVMSALIDEKVRLPTHGEGLDDVWEGSREQHDLSFSWTKGQQLLNDGCEFITEEFVRFVHYEHFTLSQIRNTFPSDVKDTTRRTDQDMNRLLQPHDVIPQRGTSSSNHNLKTFDVGSERFADLRCL